MSPDALTMLADKLRSLAARVAHLEHSERAEVAGALARTLYASLPSPGDGSVAFCTNCRKLGEGPGSGTGVPVYRDGAGWYRMSDDTAAAT